MKNTNYSRRKFISDGSALAASALVFSSSEVLAQTSGNVKIAGQSVWPSETSWQQLKEAVDGRLIKPIAPWSSLKAGEMNEDLKNPWYLEEQAGATQSTGMYQAWDSTPSAYAVAVKYLLPLKLIDGPMLAALPCSVAASGASGDSPSSHDLT